MKVILVSGPGRIHFIETASALVRAGSRIKFICGVVPSKKWKWIYDWIGIVLGKDNLYSRLSVRFGPDGILRPVLCGNFIGESAAAVTAYLGSFRLFPWPAWFLRQSWKFYAWCCRGYIKDADVLHIRSGAGQAGVIRKAKMGGMAVIVDHSIAHPEYIENIVGGEYRLIKREFDSGPANPFWGLILMDCDEADLLLVNSDFVKKTFIDSGYPEKKIVVNYLGVRGDFIGLKKTYHRKASLSLLFTGTLEIRKGIRVLVEAMEALVAMGVDFECHMAGGIGNGYDVYEQRLNKLPVIMHGALPQERLKQLFVDCDLYIFPTLAEGCAKSAMEAMLAGLPVITTEACGLPGRAGEHWFGIEPGSADSLVGALLGLAHDESKREAIGRAGMLLGANGEYSWESYARRLQGIYQSHSRLVG